MTWRGHKAMAYRLWHPRDHIYFKRLGVGAGVPRGGGVKILLRG